jgi:hypothetical protein
MKIISITKKLGPWLFGLLILFLGLYTHAQTRIDYSDTEIAGQINLAFNDKRVFINLGGPTFEVIKPKYRYGVTIYPSLQYFDSSAQMVIGIGPHFIQKTWVYSLPIFVSGDASYLAVGVGRLF